MPTAEGDCIARSMTANGRIVVTLLQTARPSGRRILAHTPDGILLWDSDDCYDLSNAIDAYERWAQSEAGAEAGA